MVREAATGALCPEQPVTVIVAVPELGPAVIVKPFGDCVAATLATTLSSLLAPKAVQPACVAVNCWL